MPAEKFEATAKFRQGDVFGPLEAIFLKILKDGTHAIC